MIKEQNKALRLVKEKFLKIDGFSLVEENEKSVLLNYSDISTGEDYTINLESQLDLSNTFTSIFITDIHELLTSKGLLKKIRFTDDETLDADIKMTSILINEIEIDMYQIILDIEEGIGTSKVYNYVPTGFEKQDYRNYTINFDCQGRPLSLNLEKGDLLFMLTPELDSIVNGALKDDFKEMTEYTQNYINNLHKP